MGRLWGIIAVVSAAVVLGLAPSAAQNESGSERIAFTTETDPSSDVFILEAGPVERARSGTPIPVTRLTSSSQRESRAVWSPDGRLIAAERMDADGVPTVIVTTAPVSPVGTADDDLRTGTPEERDVFAGACPTWSPDSKRIAVARGEDIVVRTIEGGEERTLAPGSCPAWSPRGNEIVATQEAGKLIVIDAETGATRVLHEEPQGIVGNKAWSPDASLLAFTFNSAASGAGLAVIDADGGSRRVLAEARPGEAPRTRRRSKAIWRSTTSTPTASPRTRQARSRSPGSPARFPSRPTGKAMRSSSEKPTARICTRDAPSKSRWERSPRA